MASYLQAIQAAYDIIASDYAERFRNDLAEKPLDRAMLAAFAELVQTGDPLPVADVGCGPGHVTAHLAGLGLSVFGIDLSANMVAIARDAHPAIRFREGTMTALEMPDRSLGGVVAFYSIVHLPTDRLPGVFAEFHRVLTPGGRLLVAFQIGDEQGHRTEAFGRTISLDHYLRPPAVVVEMLGRAGFVIDGQLVREPDASEAVPRAYLLARSRA